jgi:lysophospholipase L1-like esterase
VVHLATALPLTARESITNGKQLRILPLGDSITFGWQPENQQGTNGYRAELAQRLSGSNFNFVGTLRSGDMEDNYNEGHSGFTISQIQNVMQPALDMRPNVILLHAGTNDLHNPAPEGEPYSEAPQRLDGFLDAVLQTCPDAVVIVAKLVQAANVDSNARFATYDDAIPGIVQSKIDAGYKVTVVDQSVVGPDELIDGLHP